MKCGAPQTFNLTGNRANVTIKVEPFGETSLRIICTKLEAPPIGSRFTIIEKYFYGLLRRAVEYETLTQPILEVQHSFNRYPKAGDSGETVALEAGQLVELTPYLKWGYWTVVCSPVVAQRRLDTNEVIDNRLFTNDILGIRFNLWGRNY